MKNQFLYPVNEFTVVPFWFWNDEMETETIAAQMADFRDKGVSAFVIHPRLGLPETIPFLSEAHLSLIEFSIEEAARHGMRVYLYDEAMYPSGSAHGMVVEGSPELASRGLKVIELAAGDVRPGTAIPDLVKLEAGERIVSVQKAIKLGDRRLQADSIRLLNASAREGVIRPDEAGDAPGGIYLIFVEYFTGGVIRGIHLGEDSDEAGAPLYPDVLNPEAGRKFVRIVYETYWQRFGSYFGSTVAGIFTDEPHALGKSRPAANGKEMCKPVPWTYGFLEWLREDGFAESELALLWFEADGLASSARYRYELSVQRKMGEAYYKPISEFCGKHGVQLCGHPMKSDDFGLQRYFDLPGQDVVLRKLLPVDGSALVGRDSTQGKCSSDAARHTSKRRNGNECFGGYGWELTVEDMKWIMDWLFVRGVNLLYPHAFYYSVRGPRSGDRPPDVGPNNLWWPHYRHIADYIKRMCWLNTDSVNTAAVAVLSDGNSLSWDAVKPLYESQIEFNYLEDTHLLADAASCEAGWLRIARQLYRVLIIPGEYSGPSALAVKLRSFIDGGGVVLRYAPPRLSGEAGMVIPGMVDIGDMKMLVKTVDMFVDRDIRLVPANPDIRVSVLKKDAAVFALLVNEGETSYEGHAELPFTGRIELWDAWNGSIYSVDSTSGGVLSAAEAAPAQQAGRFGSSVKLRLGRRESVIIVVHEGQTSVAEAPEARPNGAMLRSAELPFESSWSVSGLLAMQDGSADRAARNEPFGSWTEIGDCERFAGTVLYTNELEIAAVYGEYVLDCGQVGDFAEVRINGETVGLRFWHPYTFRITPWLKQGRNRFDIRVTNSMTNHYESAGRASGLLSDVKLIHETPDEDAAVRSNR